MKSFAPVIIIAAISILIGAALFDTRLAAGGGALLLLAAIIYGWARNKTADDGSYERAERGARELREEMH